MEAQLMQTYDGTRYDDGLGALRRDSRPPSPELPVRPSVSCTIVRHRNVWVRSVFGSRQRNDRQVIFWPLCPAEELLPSFDWPWVYIPKGRSDMLTTPGYLSVLLTVWHLPVQWGRVVGPRNARKVKLLGTPLDDERTIGMPLLDVNVPGVKVTPELRASQLRRCRMVVARRERVLLSGADWIDNVQVEAIVHTFYGDGNRPRNNHVLMGNGVQRGSLQVVTVSDVKIEFVQGLVFLGDSLCPRPEELFYRPPNDLLLEFAKFDLMVTLHLPKYDYVDINSITEKDEVD